MSHALAIVLSLTSDIDIGTLQRFPKACGNLSKARELVYTARSFGAEEAFSVGFLSKIVPGGLEEVICQCIETFSDVLTVMLRSAEATKLARIIASKSPIAIMSSKVSFHPSYSWSLVDLRI